MRKNKRNLDKRIEVIIGKVKKKLDGKTKQNKTREHEKM